MFFGDHLMFKTFSFKFMSSSISQLPWAKFSFSFLPTPPYLSFLAHKHPRIYMFA